VPTETETETETNPKPTVTVNGTCSPLEKKTECLNSLNDDRNDPDGKDHEFVPMFASLAHTPEQLAEIARIRESAIRERERRSRQRSTDNHDL